MNRFSRLLVCGIAVLMTTGGELSVAVADVLVKGHYRKNGTYVKPHYRSSPDASRANNWSIRGNKNPHTGRMGTASLTGEGTRTGSPHARVASAQRGSEGDTIYYGGIASDASYGEPFECKPGSFKHLRSCLPAYVEQTGYAPIPKVPEVLGGGLVENGWIR